VHRNAERARHKRRPRSAKANKKPTGYTALRNDCATFVSFVS
jgi:hypothetical protein